jgi:hypothetical protein
MSALDEVKIPVTTKMTVLESVIQVWRSSLIAMDNLVTGTAQRIQNGAVLLGLASWHLYPDLLVLGTGKTDILRQHDSLIKNGGLLTIGLHINTLLITTSISL